MFGYFSCLHVIYHVKHFKILEKVAWFQMSKLRSVFLNYIVLLLDVRENKFTSHKISLPAKNKD